MSAKILGVIVFIFFPSLALAQSGDQTLARIETSQRGLLLAGSGNGSDGGGCMTPSGGESDANAITAPSSKPPIAFRGEAQM
jgi:hypothetical protein